MSLLSSAGKAATTLSPPLPVVNKILNHAGLTFRQGQFSLLAAAPGVGKSVFATNLSIFTRVPTVFFSADSDEWTVKSRACSILTGTPLDLIEDQLEEESWSAYYNDKLRAADHIDWCYQTDIDPDFLVKRLQAHAELRGKYPKFVIVDNLGNSVEESGDEYAELRANCRELQRIARSTKAHVLGLHHVVGAKEDGTKPIDLSDLIGKIGKIPEMVLGLNRFGENMVNMTVPKNRGGKAGMHLQLGLNYATATVSGYQ